MDSPQLYSYGSEGVDDDGWGCVYRSFQNAQSHSGYKVIPFMKLLNMVDREWGEWSEPSDFLDIGKTVTFWTGSGKNLFRKTHKSDYIYQIPLTDIEEYMAQRKHCSFVVDDGISGYAIVPFEGQHYWIDPHTHSPRRSLFRKQLQRSPGWMVLQLFPRFV